VWRQVSVHFERGQVELGCAADHFAEQASTVWCDDLGLRGVDHVVIGQDQPGPIPDHARACAAA